MYCGYDSVDFLARSGVWAYSIHLANSRVRIYVTFLLLARKEK